MVNHESSDGQQPDDAGNGPTPEYGAGAPGAAPWPTPGSQASDPTRRPLNGPGQAGPPPSYQQPQGSGYPPQGPGYPPQGPGYPPQGPPAQSGYGPGSYGQTGPMGPGGPAAPGQMGPGGPVGPGGTEYLEQGGGQPVPPQRRKRNGKRIALITAGAVALAGVGAGSWALYGFLSTGAQPAEALPASTLGYAAIDLDPSGKQKLAALDFLNQFPAFEDEVGIGKDDDLRKKLFEEMQGDGVCTDVDYEDDVEPWLGDRFGVAAVDLGKEDPTPVITLQIKDGDKAAEGMQKIIDCESTGSEEDVDPSLDPESGSEEMGGFVVQGDWLIAAETEDLAQQVADEAEKDPLSDDDSYQRWTDEVGDAGFVNMYAGPALGDYLADHPDLLAGAGDPVAGLDLDDPMSADTVTDPTTAGLTDETVDGSTEVPQAVLDQLRDFSGAAASFRFDDGTAELAFAAENSGLFENIGFADRGGDLVADLPDDTAVAMGYGFESGWATTLFDRVTELSGGEVSTDELFSQIETETGLSLPGDLESLLGEGSVVAVGGDIDPDALSSGDIADVPIAAVIQGDTEAAQGALDKLRTATGPDGESVLVTSEDGDRVAVGPNEGYRDEVLEGGNLGGTDKYQDVVPESDKAASVLYVDFDASDDWLVELARGEGDDETAKNLEPLSALGISTWYDDDVVHGSIRVSTE